MSVAIETGTRITGLFGPIPYGCLTVSKTRNEPEGVDVEIGCLCIGLFTGYECAKRFRYTDSDCWGVRE